MNKSDVPGKERRLSVMAAAAIFVFFSIFAPRFPGINVIIITPKPSHA